MKDSFVIKEKLNSIAQGLLRKKFSLAMTAFEDHQKKCLDILLDENFEKEEGLLIENKELKLFEMESIIEDTVCTPEFVSDYANQLLTVFNLTYMCGSETEKFFTTNPFVMTVTYDDLDLMFPEKLKSERELEFVRQHKAVFVSGLGFPYTREEYKEGLDGVLFIYDKQHDACLTLSNVIIRRDKELLTIKSTFDMNCLYTLIL